MTYSETHKKTTGPREIESADSAVRWLVAKIEKARRARLRLNHASSCGLVSEALNVERGFLISYGEAMGSLLALRAAGFIDDAVFDRLKHELVDIVSGQVVIP